MILKNGFPSNDSLAQRQITSFYLDKVFTTPAYPQHLQVHRHLERADSSSDIEDGASSTHAERSGLTPSSSWTGTGADGTQTGYLTLDSDAYSVINKVLDQYYESGAISPGLVEEFQQHLLDTYELRVIGELEWFLAIRIIRDRL